MALNTYTITVEIKIPILIKLLALVSWRAAIRFGYFWMRFLPRGDWMRVEMRKYFN